MKKIQLALLAMSLGFVSNAWSANIDLEERLQCLDKVKSLDFASRPRPPIPSKIKDYDEIEFASRPRPPIPPR